MRRETAGRPTTSPRPHAAPSRIPAPSRCHVTPHPSDPDEIRTTAESAQDQIAKVNSYSNVERSQVHFDNLTSNGFTASPLSAADEGVKRFRGESAQAGVPSPGVPPAMPFIFPIPLIRKMFNFAVQREIVAISPCMGMGRPSRPRQCDRVLNYDEIGALWLALDACPPVVADVLRLELLTGMSRRLLI